MPQGKGQGSVLSFVNDRDTRVTIQQNSNRLGNRVWNLNFRQQAYSHIIDHLTRWPDAFSILDKSVDTLVSTFINHYFPIYMCPRYILSDNGTEFKNQLMDQVIQQLSTDFIFFAPNHPQSNGKLEVFHKYLKPTLKKLCKKESSQLGQMP